MKIIQKTIQKNIFIFSLISLLFITSCNLLGPSRKRSSAREPNIKIDNPLKYRAAKRKLKIANKYFARKKFILALEKTNDSLSTHETWDAYYLKGAILFHTNQNVKAIEFFQKARKINPDGEQLLLTTATAFTVVGDLKEALVIYTRLQEINPTEPVYSFKKGTTLKILKRYEQAYVELKKADVKKSRFLDQTYLHLGDICLELKKYDESKKYFQKSRKLNPNLKDARSGARNNELAKILDLGNKAFQKKNYGEARQEYLRAQSFAPRSPAPLLFLGSLHLVEKEYLQASKVLTEAVKYDPKNPRGYSLLGSALHELGDYRRALKIFDSGLRIAPENAQIHNKKGLVHRSRQEYPSAISSFYKAVQINIKYSQARYNLAITLLDAQRYADARREFQQAAKLDPDNKQMQKGIRLVGMYEYLDRGDRFFQKRNFKKARIAYKKAKDVADELPVVHNSLGRLDFALKKYKSSKDYFEDALDIDKNNIPALQGLLRIYYRIRNKKQARVTIKKIEELTKNDITAAITLGRIKEDQGKFKQAAKYYLKLLKNHPKEEAVKRRLGYVYYKQGLKLNKRGYYKHALVAFQNANTYNQQIPQLPEALQISQENIKYKRLLPTLRKAERLFDQARYKEALPLLTRVYQKLKRPMILVKISNCHIALGQEDKGIELLKVAKGKGFKNLPIVEAIYTHLLNKGRVEEAYTGFKEIVSTHKEAHFSWYKLGVIELMKKKHGSALENLSQAILHKPSFSIAYIARGVVYYEQGKKEEAKQEIKKALKSSTFKTLASFNMGILFFNDGLMDKAENLFKELLEKNPRFIDARYQLSYIYFEKGKFDQAQKELRSALKIKKQARLYHGLSRIYEKQYLAQKTPENAIHLRDVYRQIITHFPDSKYAQESRAKLIRVIPNSRIAQPYSKLKIQARKPNLYNGDLLYFSGKDLISVRSSTKKENWQVKFPSKPKKMIADLFIHVLLKNEFWIIDSSDGSVLKKVNLKEKSFQMIGGYNQIGIVYNIKKPVLTVYNQFGKEVATSNSLIRSRYFFFQRKFYMIAPAGNKLSVVLLDSKLIKQNKVLLKSFSSRSRPRLQFSKKRIHIYKGSRLVSLDSDLDDKIKIRLPSNTAYFVVDSQGSLFVPSAHYIMQYSKKGKFKKRIKLPQQLISRKSVRVLKDSFLYIGRDYKVYKVGYNGQKKWELPINQNNAKKSQAYSLYY